MQDLCVLCEKYREHKTECTTNQDCTVCKKAEMHKRRAETAREEYQNMADGRDLPPNTSVFAADMQKVVLLPKLETKEHFLCQA